MRFSDNQDSDATGYEPLQSGSSNPSPANTFLAKSSITGKLEHIKKAIRQGQYEQAYVLSRELTRLAPDSIEAWLYCAVLTRDREQGFTYLSQALNLAPEHTRARRGLYEMLKYHMAQDPFLRYLEESGPLYRVLTGESGTVIVPKDREITAPFQSEKPASLQTVYRWLRYSLLGLPLAGIPTLVCASVAWVCACHAIYLLTGTSHLRRAEAALVYATFLWGTGFLLSFIFLLHL